MTREEKFALLQEVFDTEEGVLRDDVLLADLDSWNSMTKLSLVVLMDETFQKDLTAAAVRSFVKVADILDFME